MKIKVLVTALSLVTARLFAQDGATIRQMGFPFVVLKINILT